MLQFFDDEKEREEDCFRNNQVLIPGEHFVFTVFNLKGLLIARTLKNLFGNYPAVKTSINDDYS